MKKTDMFNKDVSLEKVLWELRRKYDELTEMHKKKMIMLYSEGLIPFGLMKYDGIFSGEISHKELFDYMDNPFVFFGFIVTEVLSDKTDFKMFVRK